MISVNFYINFIVFHLIVFSSAPLSSIVSGAVQIMWLWLIEMKYNIRNGAEGGDRRVVSAESATDMTASLPMNPTRQISPTKYRSKMMRNNRTPLPTEPGWGPGELTLALYPCCEQNRFKICPELLKSPNGSQSNSSGLLPGPAMMLSKFIGVMTSRAPVISLCGGHDHLSTQIDHMYSKIKQDIQELMARVKADRSQLSLTRDSKIKTKTKTKKETTKTKTSERNKSGKWS